MTATLKQIKARQSNWTIVRLKGAASVFNALHYNFSDPAFGTKYAEILKKAREGDKICRELQVLIKELYWKEIEFVKNRTKKGVSSGSVE